MWCITVLFNPRPSKVLTLHRALNATWIVGAISISAELMRRSFDAGRRNGFRALLVLTTLLECSFLCITGIELWSLLELGLNPNSGLFGTTFGTLSGFHLLHVAGGLLALVILLVADFGRILRPVHAAGVEAVSMFLQFINVVLARHLLGCLSRSNHLVMNPLYKDWNLDPYIVGTYAVLTAVYPYGAWGTVGRKDVQVCDRWCDCMRHADVADRYTRTHIFVQHVHDRTYDFVLCCRCADGFRSPCVV